MSAGKETIAIKELPPYPDRDKLDCCHHVKKDAVPGQGFVHGLRVMGEDLCGTLSERLGFVNKSLDPVRDAANVVVTTGDYVRRERDVQLQAAAIAVGGMIGLVAAMRKGGKIRKTFYTLTGMLTVAAFCFPHETVQLARTGIAHSKMTWENFKQAPEPKK